MSSWLLQFVDCTVYTIVFTKTWALKYKMNPRLLLKIHLLTCLFKYDRKLTPRHVNFLHWKIRLCTTFRISGALHKTNALKKLLKLFPNNGLRSFFLAVTTALAQVVGCKGNWLPVASAAPDGRIIDAALYARFGAPLLPSSPHTWTKTHGLPGNQSSPEQENARRRAAVTRDQWTRGA